MASVLPALLATSVLAAPSAALVRAQVSAVRAQGTIRVDGVLSEPDWQRAQPIRDFRRIFVAEGEPPSDSTEVRVLFDDRAIYFGIRCTARGPGAIRASLAPRDQIDDGDFVAIHLDTYRDLHRAYIFAVNPFGVQLDGILDGSDPSFDWDGVWDAECARDDSGWTAEMAIPLRTLRFPANGPGVWGLWIRRVATRDDELSSWPLWRQKEQGDIMLQAADLTGLQGLTGGGALEVQPYAASVTNGARAPSPVDGALSPWDQTTDWQGGADLKYAPLSNLVLSVTANPDYSQIEADALQIDINQRYPLYYPEKRPFFLEGAEIFTTPIDLVYTRRIADPAAGVKFTGKGGAWRFGALAAWDRGGGSGSGVGAGESELPIRSGQYGIARLTRDLGENSSVGLLVTAHATDARDGAPPAAGAIENGGGNLVAGADARLRLGPALFFTGQLVGSATRFDSLGVPHEATRTRDIGYDATLRFADGVREAKLISDYLGPDFRAETGFLQRVDQRRSELDLSVIARPENAWLRSWQPILDGYLIHDHAGTLQEAWVSPMIDWQFQKQTHAHTMAEWVRERWHSRDYDQRRYTFVFDNTLVRAAAVSIQLVAGDGIYYGGADSTSFLGWREQQVVQLTLRPLPRFTFTPTLTHERFWRSRFHSEIYDIGLFGGLATWQFTRRLYARLYPQFDTSREHLDADGLLGYVVHPGTVLYLGYGRGLDHIDGHSEATRRSMFFKGSYLFRR